MNEVKGIAIVSKTKKGASELLSPQFALVGLRDMHVHTAAKDAEA